jgi:catechol 2,3-dioxygenase-like lactoylglutathione lyase family enzyme
MERVISGLIEQFERGTVTRRELVRALAAVAAGVSGGAGVSAQRPGFRTLNLDHINYISSDYRRTRDFYAGVLGMSVANDNGKSACELLFGDARGVGVRDRAMMSVRNVPAAAASAATSGPARAGIDHLAFKIDGWDTASVRAELDRRGLKPQLLAGGAIDTPNYMSFMVQDPDGIGVQISGIARPGDPALKRP